MREIHSAFLSALKDRGHITKQDVKDAREAFHAAIEDKVEMRNSVVHGRPTFSGEAHFDLNLTSMLHNRGQTAVKRETGEEFTVAQALERACGKVADVLDRHGKEVVKLMNAFIVDSVAITKTGE
jgi:hypothetical protein